MFGCYYRNEQENRMPNMTLDNIAKVCEGTYYGPKEQLQDIITGVVTDSRQVRQDHLFIPIRGERADGHDFIEDVFEKGALAVLSERKLQDPSGAYILVRSTTDAMEKLAEFYRQQLSVKVVGITGSVGKTSTKEMIASILEQKYSVHKTEGNFNNEIGLPLTIFKIKARHEIAVLEMGISDFGEMHRLAQMAAPDISVITNIGLCHLENLGTRDGILRAKTEVFEHMRPGGTVILNGDDDKLSTISDVNGKAAVFYGIGEKPHTLENGECLAERTIYATDIENKGMEGMYAKFHTPEGSFDVTIPIPGEHNVYNALAGTAVGLELGLTHEQIQKGIESVKTIAGRNNLLKIAGMTVIDDCYNANPVSMKASINVLAHSKGRKIAVLGDMGELGEDEKKLHYEVGTCIAESGIDTMFCTGTLSKEYVAAVEKSTSACEVHYLDSREELIRQLLSYVTKGDVLLVKASHFMEFPKVIEALKGLAES